MVNFQVANTAAPRARSGELAINGKTVNTPTYFATLTRVTEPDQVTGAVQVLDEQGEPPLPNTGGFVVESHLAPDILGGIDRTAQTDLNGQRQFSNLYAVIDILEKCLLIDPNTDRLLYSNYRGQLDPIRDFLPDPFTTTADALNGEEDVDLDISHEEAYPYIQDNVSRPNMVENMLNLQAEFDADLFLAPYYPIELDSYERDVEENIELYRVTKSLADRLYDRPVAPVLPVKTSVIGADAEQENGQRQPPQAWLDIIHAYRNLDSEVLFLKTTNVETDPDKLHKTDSEGIFHFFRQLRGFTDMPTFFLGLDEFSYILMTRGLDGYSHPVYNSPYRKPMQPGDNIDHDNISQHRKFLVPRKWGWEKFDQLDSLGCNCPFCQPFNDTDPIDIEFGDQDRLRMRHWLWLRDEEIRELNDAITKDEVRPGLRSICNDSEWKKNFTMFL